MAIPPKDHRSRAAVLILASLTANAGLTLADPPENPAADSATKTEAAPAPAAEKPNAAPAEEEEVDLIYDRDCREIPRIYKGISKQKEVAASGVTKAELVKVYDVADGPLKLSPAVVKAEIEGSFARTCAVASSSPSILFYGPYEKLAAGSYLVVYRFQVTDSSSAGTELFLDVCHQACTRSGLRLDAARLPEKEWLEIAVPLTLPAEKDLEFRFWPGGRGVVVDRVYVLKVSSRNDVAKIAEKTGEPVPAARPVPGRTDVAYSPHNEEGGMIDISGCASGEVVRCPYSGKFFLVP